MIEQPLPSDADGILAEVPHAVPIYADESCHDRASLDSIVGKYDGINIKLDKTGGLTEALALKQAAEAAGLRIMVGCMVATSLAMAPAMLLAQGAAIADLDGALLLARDRDHGLEFAESKLFPSCVALWG
jgi:L-alanine-DL-glutamate epimerase-like enolase superfamily enzyme